MNVDYQYVSVPDRSITLENTITNMVNNLLEDDLDTSSSHNATTSISSSISNASGFDEDIKSPLFNNSNDTVYFFEETDEFTQEQPHYDSYTNIFNSTSFTSYATNNNLQTTLTTEQAANYINYLLYEISPLVAHNDKIDMAIYQKLKGHFVEVIKSQNGSRIFQTFLKKTHYHIIHLIYQEIKHSIYDIITNFYGNYFFKKFYKCLHKKERTEILSIIKPHFMKLAFDSVGTFPIQSIIENATSSSDKKFILKMIKPYIKEFCSDQYGSHVIEKIISCFGNEHTYFIFDYILTNILELSKDPCGICVTKAMIRHLANKNDDLFQRTHTVLLNNMNKIVYNQFGNQVIQTVIQYWDINQLEELINVIQCDFVELSIGKYSSTVIEAFLEKNDYLFSLFIKEISKKNQMIQIMKNCYGNYVIQKALKISSGFIKKYLIEYINKNLYKLNEEKLIMKWVNILEQYIPIGNKRRMNGVYNVVTY